MNTGELWGSGSGCCYGIYCGDMWLLWAPSCDYVYLCESVKCAGHQHEMGYPTYVLVLRIKLTATSTVTE